MTAPVALPLLGDVMLFLSREMRLRPIQLRANAEDAPSMMPAARGLSERLQEWRVPVTIVAGDSDAIVDIEAHSKRLHQVLPGSRLVVVRGAGHRVHDVAQQQIAEAVSPNAAESPWPAKDAMSTEPVLIAQ